MGSVEKLKTSGEGNLPIKLSAGEWLKVDLDAPEYKKLKNYVIDDFKSFVPGENQFCPKNAFIGLYLRMNVLMNMNDSKLLAKNLETFCIDMSRTTGTLWEYRDGYGSLDHGFASYVALTIPLADTLP